MKKVDTFIMAIIVIVAIAIVFVVVTFMLDTTGLVNQGNFRVNDAVINSTIDVIEKNSNPEEVTEIPNMIFDLSQKNKLSLLITKTEEISSMYIDNIVCTNPIKLGELYLSQTGYEEKYSMDNSVTRIELYPEEKDNQYYVELNFNNDFCIKDVNVPDQTKLVKFDGTMLELINIKISDLYFTVSFDLTIVDSAGKNNVCSVNLKMPDEMLITNGISVIRQNLANYIFTIKK